MNGDIVSPDPTIRVSLKDENKTILIQDSSLFEVSVKYPNGDTKSFDPNDPDVIFTPASDAKNLASFEIQQTFPQDGMHELIVQGKDASGNKSGKNELKIEFQVIHALTRANVVPYPNPFTTSTRFLYTITGRVPTIFKIQILTLDGSIVKEIDLSIRESLKIGTHLTDYSWDGTDNFNDQLANGIYLYRVIMKDENHETFDLMNSSLDQNFEKNLGKIVILR